MQKIYYKISGFILGILPQFGAAIFGILAYNELPNIYGILICIVLVFLALRVGLHIFRRVQIVGPIEVMSGTTTSPELDHLEPTDNCDFKRRSPQEFVALVKEGKQLFREGSFRIFGAWFGRPYKKKHLIKSAEFNQVERILTLYFSENEKLIITNPRNIFEATTYFKILKADKIKLEWFSFGKQQIEENMFFNSYYIVDNEIKAVSNFKKSTFDLSKTAPALMIYGF